MLLAIFFCAIVGSMKTPSEILEFVGMDRAQVALGVGRKRIHQARDSDKLPASWLHTLENLAGRPLPREAFNFKGAA